MPEKNTATNPYRSAPPNATSIPLKGLITKVSISITGVGNPLGESGQHDVETDQKPPWVTTSSDQQSNDRCCFAAHRITLLEVQPKPPKGPSILDIAIEYNMDMVYAKMDGFGNLTGEEEEEDKMAVDGQEEEGEGEGEIEDKEED
ncbi:MAG: hypothetical protein Q9202_000566 [Teloschistes flavicans]